MSDTMKGVLKEGLYFFSRSEIKDFLLPTVMFNG